MCRRRLAAHGICRFEAAADRVDICTGRLNGHAGLESSLDDQTTPVSVVADGVLVGRHGRRRKGYPECDWTIEHREIQTAIRPRHDTDHFERPLVECDDLPDN